MSLVTIFMLDIMDVTHLFTFSVMAILTGGVWRVVAPGFTTANLVVSTDQIAFVVEGLAKALNAFFVHARGIIMWDDMIATVKAILALQVLKVFLPCVMSNALLIAFLKLNMVFILPAAYNLKHEHIRAALGPHVEKAAQAKNKLLQRVPRYIDVVKDM